MFYGQSIFIRFVAIFTLMLCVFFLTSCKKKEEAPVSLAETTDRAAHSAPADVAAESGGESALQGKNRKIILNHSIGLQVKEFQDALEEVTKLAETSGGYVFNSSRSSRDDDSVWGEVGIRVPVAKAGGVMAGIRALGMVESENSTAEDITDEYVDLDARLNNAKSSEVRLLELNRRAGKLTDVLAVEKELARVRGDIEAFQAKKKNWDILTEMATINITMHEKYVGFPTFSRLYDKVRNGFVSAVEVFADSLAALITFLGMILPWIIVLGPLAYLFVRRRRKRKQEISMRAPKNETAH